VTLVAARRIVVLGSPGSGKTTFSGRLHALLGLPLHHLDDEYWLSGWRRISPAEFAERQRALVDGDHWIIDGNHFPTLPIRLARADAVCLLDVSTWVALAGFVKRALQRAMGERESLPRAIRLDSSYRWRPGFSASALWTILTYNAAIRPQIVNLCSAAHSTPTLLRIVGRRDTAALLDALAVLAREPKP